MPLYNFNKQLERGQDGETYLDTFFSGWYYIQEVSLELQRQGIDRLFIRRKDGTVYKVEYKTDFIAHTTGNIFIETVSVDTENKPGWAYSSWADFLIYYIPGNNYILICRFVVIKKHIKKWRKQYPYKEAHNESYKTGGVLVPIASFRDVCVKCYLNNTAA